MRILFLSRWFPYPADNGSRIRVWNLLQALSARHTVDLVSFVSNETVEYVPAALSDICSSVVTAPYRNFQPKSYRAALGYFSNKPRSVTDTFSREFYEKACATAVTNEPDLVISSQIDMLPYAAAAPRACRMAEELELSVPFERAFQRENSLQRWRHRLTWTKLHRYLSAELRGYSACTVVSSEEQSLLTEVAPANCRIKVIPNGATLLEPSNPTNDFEPDSLIYSGALTYQANFDAVLYFLEEIFPLIREKRPAVKFYVTGRLDGVQLGKLPSLPGVVFTGYVDDIRTRVACSCASVVPLRIGGGTRLKVLESMALGTPVIATLKGLEGLELRPGQDVLAASDAQDFAEKTIRVLEDSALRASLSQCGRDAVAAKYDWADIGRQFLEFVETLGDRHRLQTSGGARSPS